ncbi:ferredoxin reductase domain-containing protein [Streptomyces turgidiscabies]|nr:hypothetical protein [Streptomyces turgidiscabies]
MGPQLFSRIPGGVGSGCAHRPKEPPSRHGRRPGAPSFAPSDTELGVSVKRVTDGRMPSRLHELPTASRVLLSGPYGQELTTSDHHRPLLPAVARIGVTPVPGP